MKRAMTTNVRQKPLENLAIMEYSAFMRKLSHYDIQAGWVVNKLNFCRNILIFFLS